MHCSVVYNWVWKISLTLFNQLVWACSWKFSLTLLKRLWLSVKLFTRLYLSVKAFSGALFNLYDCQWKLSLTLFSCLWQGEKAFSDVVQLFMAECESFLWCWSVACDWLTLFSRPSERERFLLRIVQSFVKECEGFLWRSVLYDTLADVVQSPVTVCESFLWRCSVVCDWTWRLSLTLFNRLWHFGWRCSLSLLLLSVNVFFDVFQSVSERESFLLAQPSLNDSESFLWRCSVVCFSDALFSHLWLSVKANSDNLLQSRREMKWKWPVWNQLSAVRKQFPSPSDSPSACDPILSLPPPLHLDSLSLSTVCCADVDVCFTCPLSLDISDLGHSWAGAVPEHNTRVLQRRTWYLIASTHLHIEMRAGLHFVCRSSS